MPPNKTKLFFIFFFEIVDLQNLVVITICLDCCTHLTLTKLR